MFPFFTSVILTGPAQVAILLDDMIATGSRLALAAQSLKENGETRTYALVSHGVSLASPAFPQGFTSGRPFSQE